MVEGNEEGGSAGGGAKSQEGDRRTEDSQYREARPGVRTERVNSEEVQAVCRALAMTTASAWLGKAEV